MPTKMVSVRIDTELLKSIEERAEKEHRTLSNVIATMLIDANRKGKWKRMSDLPETEDVRYECSHCGNVVRYKDMMDLYTFNSYCGRCGSYNGFEIPCF